jgi:hypothetical protein
MEKPQLGNALMIQRKLSRVLSEKEGNFSYNFLQFPHFLEMPSQPFPLPLPASLFRSLFFAFCFAM